MDLILPSASNKVRLSQQTWMRSWIIWLLFRPSGRFMFLGKIAFSICSLVTVSHGSLRWFNGMFTAVNLFLRRSLFLDGITETGRLIRPDGDRADACVT